MDKDKRKLKPVEQELIRKQAIQLLKSGQKIKDITNILGVHRATVSRWKKAYEEEGNISLEQKKRGRPEGSCRTLKPEQETELQKALIDKCPDQLKLPFALWTRIAVKNLIHQLWSIKMPIRTVGEYLKRWGYTPQKPLRRAYKQNPKAVGKWLAEEYPSIKERAKKENAEIHWGDETGLCNDTYHGRSFAPKGQTPAIKLYPRCERVNLISTVTNQGKVRFMVYDKKMNSKVLIKFMTRLIKGSDLKIFLILDNLRVHHSYVVKDWLKLNESKIEVFFLPSYSPELNPDEYLNCDLKAGVHSGTPARTKKDLKKKAISHLRKLQKLPKRVSKYFDHRKIDYAA